MSFIDPKHTPAIMIIALIIGTILLGKLIKWLIAKTKNN